MSDFLDQMGRSSRRRAQAVRLEDCRLDGSTPPAVRPLVLSGFDLIAEVKLSAPSVGVIQAPADPIAAVVAQAQAYAVGGAAAISVLTEPDRFGGHMDHLRAVSKAVDIPVMRKDFVVDPIQVYEARAAGASGVLLILAMLDDAQLSACLQAASTQGLFVLLEAFDAQELDRAAAFVGPGVLLGLNCRDLRTLEVRPGRLEALSTRFPPGAPRVAESGLSTPEDAARLAAAGYQAALVGTALMRAADPAALTAEILVAGRGKENRCAHG